MISITGLEATITDVLFRVHHADRGEGLALIGVTAAAAASLLMLTALAVTAATRGAAVVLRVGGSWIAATGLLLAGWSFAA